MTHFPGEVLMQLPNSAGASVSLSLCLSVQRGGLGSPLQLEMPGLSSSSSSERGRSDSSAAKSGVESGAKRANLPPPSPRHPPLTLCRDIKGVEEGEEFKVRRQRMGCDTLTKQGGRGSCFIWAASNDVTRSPPNKGKGLWWE